MEGKLYLRQERCCFVGVQQSPQPTPGGCARRIKKEINGVFFPFQYVGNAFFLIIIAIRHLAPFQLN